VGVCGGGGGGAWAVLGFREKWTAMDTPLTDEIATL
jgi:hypothetical protein